MHITRNIFFSITKNFLEQGSFEFLPLDEEKIYLLPDFVLYDYLANKCATINIPYICNRRCFVDDDFGRICD